MMLIDSLQGEHYSRALEVKRQQFNAKFSDSFSLDRHLSSNSQSVAAARNTFSNLIGGVGYFYGRSLVRSVQLTTSNREQPAQRYWASQLLTAVPSRPFFPRGFLWDEGFHQLVIG